MIKSITEAHKNNLLNNIQLIATDMDGTLTKNGKFTSELILALEALQDKNIDVLIVTGRSAGWVQSIANYLPIVGAIAENGGVFYHNETNSCNFLTPIQDLTVYRQKLSLVFQSLKQKFPQISQSEDNRFRVTDWTFDIGDLTSSQLTEITAICQQVGWGFTYSTVQCHIKPFEQDKAIGLELVLNKYFPQLTREEIVTVGDSPNDESLFNQNLFPLSVGVANISDYCDRLKYQPTYITSQAEVTGFCQLADILQSREEI
ncbi:MAG: HAD family hydrolase [Xenococcus sp. (in: cyanobacteria)]